jgi:hypothetical protein
MNYSSRRPGRGKRRKKLIRTPVAVRMADLDSIARDELSRVATMGWWRRFLLRVRGLFA